MRVAWSGDQRDHVLAACPEGNPDAELAQALLRQL
jgi:hypothetical protein